jgi:DNA-binding PadR family transcriptional regulator
MTSSSSKFSEFLPLREPTYFILLSLAAGNKHGYAILKDVEELSQGKVKLSTGTLYEAIARLLDQGLIDRVENSNPTREQGGAIHPGKPRKDYRLSQLGIHVLNAELDRLDSLLAAARKRPLGERA